jgi:agmatine deiminase
MTTSYRMPPEWAAHERCWMIWPARDGLWSDPAATRQAYAAVARAIADFEPVTMIVPPEQRRAARALLGDAVSYLELPVDDSWCRDSGPNFVVSDSGAVAGVCFRFNAWGGKYHPFADDAALAGRVLAALGLPALHSPLVAEGGGISVDGEGTLLTTDSCFPNRNRNPDWSRAAIDEELMARLGVSSVVWLPGDPLDAETDGHVDGSAVFARPGAVVVGAPGDDDPDRAAYFERLHAAVSAARDARGRPLELLPLPEAPSRLARNKERFCLSYVNFYIANGAVIAPEYGVKTDDEVRERLRDYFPGREIVLVPIAAIAEGGGGIHCITQQQPRGT